jgi:hypothetical protein
LVLAVVRDGDGDGLRGSEPIVAVVETLLSEENVDFSLVVDLVDPMEAIVEVLRSAFVFGTLLDAEVEVGTPRGLAPFSTSFHRGIFNSFKRGPYSSRPVLPCGATAAPLCATVPGIACSLTPCLARQRGFLRPKRGIEACIGSSFFPPRFMEGWSGKSWNVRGTPI